MSSPQSSSVNSPEILQVVGSNWDWDSVPSYQQFILGSFLYFKNNLIQIYNNYKLSNFTNDFVKCWDNITISDIIIVTLLSVGWTILRQKLTDYVYKPIGQYFKLPKSNINKLPESAWKFSFYLCSWISMAYILLFKSGCQLFSKPTLAWKDYSINSPISIELYIIYILELSFYIHSIYASSCIDLWRKDTPTLILHHVFCVILIGGSFIVRSHKVGILAMFFHDGCDIILEGCKLTRYFKHQGDKVINWIENVTNIGFVCFTLAWFFSRLYWFPLKAIWMSSVYMDYKQIPSPFMFPLNILVWFLLGMDLYWFSFIIRLIYKVATGQVKQLEDIREEQDEDDVKVGSNDKQNQVNDKLSNERYYLRARKSIHGYENGRSN